MKEQVKTPVVVVIVVAVVAAVGYFGMKAMGSTDLDHGQIQYTPGKPPWQESDPAKRGPGGAPSVSGQTAAPPQPGSTPPPTNGQIGGPPPGMSAPVLGNGKG